MKLLITGGSGFIGMNLVSHLAERYELMNIDIKKPKINEHLKFWKNIDITDFEQLKHAVEEFNPQYIIHLAARTDLNGETLNDYNANIQGVENIVKVAKNLTQLKKIIITSSMLVCHVGYIPKDQFDYSATTLYGKSKIETERITWQTDFNCDWAIIRPTSIWGPWFDVPYRNFFNMVKKKMYVHIGNKGCTKTYGYIGNSVYQIEQILKADTTSSENKVFYIGDEPAINIKEWADQIASELGYKVHTVPWSLIKVLAFVGDMMKKMGINAPMSSFRLKNMTTNNIIDLKPTYEIAPNPPYKRLEAIKETLKWMEKH